MDSKDDPNVGAHRHNTATDNSDTIAMQKKRARRVSFAETTSVRLFNRDDEEDVSPMVETARVRDGSPGEPGFGQVSEPYMEFGGEDGDSDNDEDRYMRRSFLRPDGSPSPEDDLFGPVSANFIRPGRVYDSEASDDNHDVTMDSTAFSMHFQSLVRSESGVDLKTPTESQLYFEEKTPKNANTGSSMAFTLGKKALLESSRAVTEVSGSHNSNDMSLVVENPRKYDYDKLSPGLDALLAESRKDLLHGRVSDDIITSPSPKPKEAEVLPSIDHGDNLIKPSCIDLPDDETAACIEAGETNGHAEISVRASSAVKNSPNGAACNIDNDEGIKSQYRLSKNGSETPLASAYSPTKQQNALITVSSVKQRELASPLTRPGSMPRNGSLEHQNTQTSIQKSISKLELLERSALSSAFSAKVDNSFVKTLDFFKSPTFDPLLGNTRHISRINFEDSINEDKLASVHQLNKSSYAPSRDRAGAETRDHISDENHVEKHLGQIVGGKSPKELRAEDVSKDQLKCGGTVSSPSKITWSGGNFGCSLFTTQCSKEDAVMTETESLLAEIVSSDGGKGIVTSEFVASPVRRLGNKLSASLSPPSTQTKDLFLQNHLKQMRDFYKKDLSPGRIFANATLSTEIDNQDVDADGRKNLIEKQATDDEVDLHNGKEIFGTTDYFCSPAKEKRLYILNSEDQYANNLAGKGISGIEDNLPESSRAGFNESISSSACGDLNESRFQKNQLDFCTATSSKKEFDTEQLSGTPSPKTTKWSGRPEELEAGKRNLELLLRDTQHRDEMTSMQRSPKVQKVGKSYSGKTFNLDEDRVTLTVHERKKWNDIYSKFSEDLKYLFSGSSDNLNREMIDALEDALVYQQRSKVYEMLHDGVFPQSSTVHHDLQLEKMAETNLLMHRVVFEKAKLQLNHVKKERLLKRLQLLSSRLQESQKLGENIASQPLQTCTSAVVDAVGDQILSVNLKKEHEVCQEKLTAMRQTLDTLDRKILNLTKTFQTRCKIKAEPSSADTIALVNKHLTEKASCRLIRLEVQMYVVQSVSSVNGQHNVVLNYLDFVTQSIKILVGPASSVSISFKLNETNIIKNFPNMDACVAFAYVFNAETTRKYIGSKTLPQETQVSKSCTFLKEVKMQSAFVVLFPVSGNLVATLHLSEVTSSLLGNLLDLVDEVQSVQMVLPDLTQSSFCSPSAEQLHLVLCFFNFTSGRKVNLTLDISCLKRGIYPSEIVPLQLASPGDRDKALSTSTQPMLDDIKEAVKDVKTGYMRVLRLCKCVSQVVRASTL
ncbi:nucleoid occlusion protein [Striga asiatica]|uniref:Nucleoid occlusion protein n=1 Tax=Striga asiatica TaxID=4170 RepID=A0A5A7PLV2_STRAF|nr:nucleoid occlusion protein [Striga asiatica]